MTNYRLVLLAPLAFLLSSTAAAQFPDEYWEFRRPYDDELLHVHPLMNYAFDLQWQYEWERRQMSDNSVRVASGSVAADSLLTDMNININQALNDKWRFQGRFRRVGSRQRNGGDEQLFLGFEREIFDSSGIYLMVNPQYDKEFMDITAGYTFYKDDREQYVRTGVVLEDFAYDSKNDMDGVSAHQQLALQWQVRLELANEWFLYTEGDVGNGFDRTFDDPRSSPILARHEQRENSARVRVSKFEEDGRGWAAWIDWYDSMEAQERRIPESEYEYKNRLYNVSVEHTRIVRDRHRWRFLLHYIDQQAERFGHYEHNYDRSDVVGGVFYEYLLPSSGFTLAYAFAQPDASFQISQPEDQIELQDYSDKIIGGWRYDFSRDAQIRILISHEVSNTGFGGGSIQYQMFF